jgi:DNA-binding YbaB/EbfC family protein
MDLSKLMDMAKQFQKNMQEAQEHASALRAVGEAGAGMVKVTVNGLYECIEVKIDPSVVSSQDVTLIEDMVQAAVNQATSKVAELLKTHMGHMAKAAGLDMSAFTGGMK